MTDRIGEGTEWHSLLESLGGEIEDPEEECFVLFSSKPENHDLGFVDKKASVVDVSVGAQSFSIRQSPTLLRSERKTGTTGAVLWKVTPLLCKWLAQPENPLGFTVLSKGSTILELGSGVSGLLALSIGPRVRKFIASDQDYCLKLLKKNLEENLGSNHRASKSPDVPRLKNKIKAAKAASRAGANAKEVDVSAVALDWEEDIVAQHPELRNECFDAVFACDCIYNESLIPSFVDTLRSACALNRSAPRQQDSGANSGANSVALAIIAQELRSPDVLRSFLVAFHEQFHIWRVPDEMFKDMEVDELLNGGGFCIHVGVLREEEG